MEIESSRSKVGVWLTEMRATGKISRAVFREPY